MTLMPPDVHVLGPRKAPLRAQWEEIEFEVAFLKFGFSEKATKFEKIFVVLLTRAECSVRATANLSKS